MAPEVFKDPGVSRNTRYDVYGFGVLLWELLSGQKPFEHGKLMFLCLSLYIFVHLVTYLFFLFVYIFISICI